MRQGKAKKAVPKAPPLSAELAASVAKVVAKHTSRILPPETIDLRALGVLVNIVDAYRKAGAPMTADAYPQLRELINNIVFILFAEGRGLADKAENRARLDLSADDSPDVLFALEGLVTWTDRTPIDYGALEVDWLGQTHERLLGFTIEDGEVVASSQGTSHYTPRSLTDVMVPTTLRPILAVFGPNPTPDQLLSLRICDPSVGGGAFLLALVRYMGPLLIEAWRHHGQTPNVPDLESCAKQLIAIHCAYAVDICADACRVTKRVMWLECRAKAFGVGWMDSNVKCGDALVGLSREQLTAFTWKPEGGEVDAELAALYDRAVDAGVAVRKAEMTRLTAIAISVAP